MQTGKYRSQASGLKLKNISKENLYSKIQNLSSKSRKSYLFLMFLGHMKTMLNNSREQNSSKRKWIKEEKKERIEKGLLSFFKN